VVSVAAARELQEVTRRHYSASVSRITSDSSLGLGDQGGKALPFEWSLPIQDAALSGAFDLLNFGRVQK
jgi:hypothetical protein